MAPTNGRSTRRRGIFVNNSGGRLYRNADTTAGVSRNHSAAPRDGHHARTAHRRFTRIQRPQPSANASTGPQARLASRITSGDGRGRAYAGDGDTARPRPQRGRRLQDRMTDDRVSGGAIGDATQNLQANHRSSGQDMHTVAATDDGPDMDDIDKFSHANSQINNTVRSFSQASALFCGSQPTQLADPPVPLSPPITFSLPAHRVRPATTPRPIRMFNQPLDDEEVPATPKRPVNTYRGKDPIKKIVQNKKLQAIFADKPMPKDRKKWKDERVELRMGASKITK